MTTQKNGPESHARANDDALEIMEPLCAVFRRHLKSLNQKYTPERAQILDALMQFEDLFEVEQLQECLNQSGHGVSKATIYRTLKLLQDAGIIQQVLVDSEQAHYQLAYGNRQMDLIVRLDTDETIAIEIPELVAIRRRLCAEHGLIAQGHRFIVYAAGPESA